MKCLPFSLLSSLLPLLPLPLLLDAPQDPPPASRPTADPKQDPKQDSDAGVRPDAARAIEDKEAKELVSEYKKNAGRKSDLRTRLEAVNKLARYRNDLFINPLVHTVRTDKAQSVRKAAAEALGSQPPRRARAALTALLNGVDIEGEPGVAAGVIRAFDRCCYDSRDWERFEKMFQKVLTAKEVADPQQAILELAGNQKELKAIDFLLEHIDPPEPEWVDDPNNPPASYWEARWANWSKWKGQVKEALFQITGQRFNSKKEAKEWLSKNRQQLAPQKG